MGGRACGICSHIAVSEINKQLGLSVPFRTIAARYSTTHTSLQRHKANCLRVPGKRKEADQPVAATSVPGTTRYDSASAISTPADLLTRLRSLFRLGDLLEEAYRRKDIDACVKLAREYRAAAESYAKVAGWLNEGPTISVDARRQSVEVFSQLSLDEIKALANEP
jgi:hypothetical protein